MRDDLLAPHRCVIERKQGDAPVSNALQDIVRAKQGQQPRRDHHLHARDHRGELAQRLRDDHGFDQPCPNAALRFGNA